MTVVLISASITVLLDAISQGNYQFNDPGPLVGRFFSLTRCIDNRPQRRPMLKGACVHSSVISCIIVIILFSLSIYYLYICYD